VLFEGTDRMGGQINLATKIGHRENLSGVTRWLESQTRKLPVALRMQTMATAEVVKAEAPDLVIVATGGRPNPGRFRDSALVATGQDILSGRVAPGETVLVYDDQNDHQGVSVAEYLAERGARVELVTPDWMTASKLGPTNRPIHIRNLHARGVVMTPDLRLEGVEAEGNRIVAVLHNDYSEADEERLVDQVVVEHGTLPNEELYFALRPDSANLGEVDFDALLEGRPQEIATNPAGAYRLFRIGDAVTSRNIHAAIYDALRLCKDF
jgi:NADPH-dependent 2,4-dienoyl-CoA reductase/sulfur reductase-like enzyme